MKSPALTAQRSRSFPARKRPRRISAFSLGAVVVIVAVTTACESPKVVKPPSPDSTTVVQPSWVVGAAAAQLGSDGKFLLDPPLQDTTQEITEPRAREIGSVVLRTMIPYMRPTIESDRGGRVNVSALTLCTRAYYAASPYAAPPITLSGIAKREIGAWWLLPLCETNGVVVAVLGVAANNKEIQIVSGHLDLGPRVHGFEFYVRGVPLGMDGTPESPEAAVAAAYARTGARVTTVPRLVRVLGPNRTEIPQFARWQVVFERTVPLTLEGEQAVAVNTVFIGARTTHTRSLTSGHLFVSADTTAADLWELPSDGPTVPLPMVRVRLARRPNSGINATALAGQDR